MNINTGEIKENPTPQDLQSGNYVMLGGIPKTSCKKCYGRGYIGKNDAGKYIICQCVK